MGLTSLVERGLRFEGGKCFHLFFLFRLVSFVYCGANFDWRSRRRGLEIEVISDSIEPCSILFHIVPFCDLCSAETEQISNLFDSQCPYCTICLFHPVYQIGGEGMSERM